MELKLIELDIDDLPFVELTLSRREARILKELLNYDINSFIIDGNKLGLPDDANRTFARPLWKKLKDVWL